MVRFKIDTLAIVVSDIHIGNEFSRLYEFTAFLKDILVMKINNNLPFLRGLIILGDLFDLNATSYDDLCSNNQYFGIYTLLDELKNNDVSIILALGNHEISTSGFLNILFFQQKNVVIFPYVDLKHLHSLEIFTAGHNIVDLESTALHDLKGLLEFESSNTYSQSPSLYFIYNLDKTKVEEVMSLENIRCVLNASENVSELVNGSNFVFFNKKSNQFLNLDETDLDFEEYLITSSGNKEVLQDTIQKIKVISSRIFAELNQNGTLDNLPQLLKEFDAKYWRKILDFTGSYFDIKIPDISHLSLPDLPDRNSSVNCS